MADGVGLGVGAPVGALGVAGLLSSKAFVNTGGTAGESGSLFYGWYIYVKPTERGTT